VLLEKPFVLIFEVDEENKAAKLIDLRHHYEICRRK